MSNTYPTVLTIAGSDSSGGAGIQADIKSISANGGYAATVITASTAQNTQGVTEIHPLPVAHIGKQLNAVLSDIRFGAVKIGMLHSFDVIEMVQHTLRKYHIDKIILDPVMISTSGKKLLHDDAFEALKHFLPYTMLVTPNIPEAELLLDDSIDDTNQKISAIKLGEIYHTSVLLKGGHLPSTDTMTDILYNYNTKETLEIHNKAIETIHTHGTGCTLSSAIATYIALEKTLEEATQKACIYLNKAIKTGKNKALGKGNGPVNHFMI